MRPATPADDQAIQALFEQAITSARWIPDGAPRDTDFKRNSGGESVLVACADDGRISGMLSVYVGGAFIHHLYVAPAHQRQGVGAALLESLEPWLPKPWRLKCVVANDQARAFYSGLGWVEIETNVGSQGPYVVLRHGPPAAPQAPTQRHTRTAQLAAAPGTSRRTKQRTEQPTKQRK